jgi:hypothetical protein
MTRRMGLKRVVAGMLVSAVCLAQSAPESGPSHHASSGPTAALKRDFFEIIQRGEADKFLSYVPKQGIDVGAQAEHVSPSEVERQFLHRNGL